MSIKITTITYDFLGKPFIIKPRECFTAVLCHDHSEDDTCAILTPEGYILTCHVVSSSYNQSLIITSETSLSKLEKYKYISVTYWPSFKNINNPYFTDLTKMILDVIINIVFYFTLAFILPWIILPIFVFILFFLCLLVVVNPDNKGKPLLVELSVNSSSV